MNARLAEWGSFETPLIAVVDDDASVRKALGRLLRAAGFDSRGYASGAEFLAACPDEPPDCVVLDVHMPGLSGLEIQRRLHDAGLRVPVFLVTADDELRPFERAVGQGVVAWLKKPFDGPILIERVGRALAEHPAVRT